MISTYPTSLVKMRPGKFISAGQSSPFESSFGVELGFSPNLVFLINPRPLQRKESSLYRAPGRRDKVGPLLKHMTPNFEKV